MSARGLERPTAVAWVMLLAFAVAGGGSGCHRGVRPLADNEALYQRAQQLLERRRFLEAVETLGELGLAAPVSDDLDPLRSLALAEAYFHQGGVVPLIEAQSRFEQFLSFHPLHPKASYARYMVGVCLMEQAQAPDNDQSYARRALAHFEKMIAETPTTDPWQRPARQMLVRAQERLAEHDWSVARFYLDRQRWRGAIGRLTTIIEHYPGTPRRPQAMLELAQAYRRSGQTAAARAAAARLLAEFPDDPTARRASALLKDLGPAESAPAGDAPGASAQP